MTIILLHKRYTSIGEFPLRFVPVATRLLLCFKLERLQPIRRLWLYLQPFRPLWNGPLETYSMFLCSFHLVFPFIASSVLVNSSKLGPTEGFQFKALACDATCWEWRAYTPGLPFRRVKLAILLSPIHNVVMTAIKWHDDLQLPRGER